MPKLPSYRNESIDLQSIDSLQSIDIDLFLYDENFGVELIALQYYTEISNPWPVTVAESEILLTVKMSESLIISVWVPYYQ